MQTESYPLQKIQSLFQHLRISEQNLQAIIAQLRNSDKIISYLNRKDEPLVKRTGLGFGLGSSKSLKKAWCSTQIFQKALQKSRLAIRNSSVSWKEL